MESIHGQLRKMQVRSSDRAEEGIKEQDRRRMSNFMHKEESGSENAQTHKRKTSGAQGACGGDDMIDPTEQDMKVLRALVGEMPARGILSEDFAVAEEKFAEEKIRREYYSALYLQVGSDEERIAIIASCIARLRVMGKNI